MKTLLIALILAFATTATAVDVAYIPNKSGGKIVLTNTDCKSGGKLVFANVPSGKAISGCWFYTYPDDHIRVLWSNSELYQYPLADLTLTDYGKKNTNPKPTTRRLTWTSNELSP